MPVHDGLWSNKHYRRAPVRPDASQGDPKQPVTRLQARAPVRPLHRHQLLPERQVFQDQFSMSAESQRQRPTDDDQQLEHVSILVGAGARINADGFWRGSACAEANGTPLSVRIIPGTPNSLNVRSKTVKANSTASSRAPHRSVGSGSRNR
jgi:hypothetical protein